MTDKLLKDIHTTLFAIWIVTLTNCIFNMLTYLENL
jgi:hypothetical protein